MKLKVKPIEWKKSTPEYFEGTPVAGIWGFRSKYRVYKKDGKWHIMEPMCEANLKPCDTPEEALQKATRHYKERILNAIEILD